MIIMLMLLTGIGATVMDVFHTMGWRSLHWGVELTTRSLCRHFGADWLDDKGRNILQKLVTLAKTGFPMGHLIWSTLIREGVSTEGILQSLCQIRANQRM